MKARFWLARVTVEATAPLAIGSGQGDDLRDALFAVSSGGLPYLPGSSLAGVLQTRCKGSPGVNCERLFGRIAAGSQDSEGSRASRLQVSHGQVHGAHNKAMPLDAPASQDPVLVSCALGVTRDHVRLDGAGVVEGAGKFDDTAVPIGARFTFELRLEEPDDAEVTAILAALGDLRLGGKTRRGFGSVAVRRCAARRFDLSESADRTAYCKLGLDLSSEPNLYQLGFKDVTLGQADIGNVRLVLKLQPQDCFLMGGGSAVESVDAHWHDGKARNKLPWSERTIRWHGDVGKVDATPVPIVPGSGVKGALRHRTLFHLRRIDATMDVPGAGDPLAPLFGEIKAKSSGGEEEHVGTPGHVFVSDRNPGHSRLTDRWSRTMHRRGHDLEHQQLLAAA